MTQALKDHVFGKKKLPPDQLQAEVQRTVQEERRLEQEYQARLARAAARKD